MEFIKQYAIEGKSIDRVFKGYLNSPEDWKAQYSMLLMDNQTCLDCRHCSRCVTLFEQKETGKSCQFYPNRFLAK